MIAIILLAAYKLAKLTVREQALAERGVEEKHALRSPNDRHRFRGPITVTSKLK